MELNDKRTNAKKFICEKCDFSCSKLSDWNRHIVRPKHRITINAGNLETPNTPPAPPRSKSHKCECGRAYNHNTGLIRHRHVCTLNLNKGQNHSTTDNNFVNKLLERLERLERTNDEHNNDLKQIIIEQHKTIIELSKKSGTYNSGNNNKTFNLQVFLNETCRNAININDFVNQIEISINELEETGKLGYAEGISKIFIKNLHNAGHNDRPIHCSDAKRETLYIKNNDMWVKDDDNNSMLTLAIKQVAHKNIRQISEWQKINPSYSDPESKENDKYMMIVGNSMSGLTKEESQKNYEKIVRNIAKEVVINKL